MELPVRLISRKIWVTQKNTNFHTVKSRPFFNNEGAHFEYRITFANWILLYVILFSKALPS